MSYAKFSSKIIVEFPDSESLDNAWFDPAEGVVGVSYKSNPEFVYEHSVEGYDDFEELINRINAARSGYHGYNKWKNERKARFQHQDRVKFDELWESLNDYQRENFYTWFTEKIKEFDPYYKTPIYMRTRKRKMWR